MRAYWLVVTWRRGDTYPLTRTYWELAHAQRAVDGILFDPQGLRSLILTEYPTDQPSRIVVDWSPE